MPSRDLPSAKAFKGKIIFAGRHQGTECGLVTPETAADKVLIISNCARLACSF